MKVCMFHLMPYRDLPDDFQQRYESVWVTPPNDELCDPEMVHKYYNWTLDELELADQLGMDGICVNEHHQNAYGFMPSPNLMAAALARRTKNSALVVLGNTLALYSPPIRVAEEFAMLDTISGGRLVAGFPVGTTMDVNHVYGINPVETRPRFYEANDLIIKAWTQPGPFHFNGKYTQLRYVNPWPKPLQKPHPPVWLAGGGSVETWEFAGNQSYAYNYLSYNGNLYGERVMKGYWETLERMNLDDNPYRSGFLQLVCVSETDELAEKEYLPHIKYFYEKCLHIAPRFATTPGYQTIRSITHARQSGQMEEQLKFRLAEKTWKSYTDNQFVIAGSPATVRDRLKDAVQRLRCGHLMVLLHIGSMSHELTMKNITLFANEVMPHIKDIWDDKYEDHWWPQRVKRQQATAQ